MALCTLVNGVPPDIERFHPEHVYRSDAKSGKIVNTNQITFIS